MTSPPPFAEKKHRTSFMRRFAPEGHSDRPGLDGQHAEPAHTIEARMAEGAEEEIRLVFQRIGEIVKEEAPALFGDYVVENGAWIPGWRKV